METAVFEEIKDKITAAANDIENQTVNDTDSIETYINNTVANGGLTQAQADSLLGMLNDEVINKLPTAGGRRHKGSKKAHKGKRHGNASLRAWVTFVKKVQKEEGVGYKEAMTLAKRRKDKGEKWRGGGDLDMTVTDAGETDEVLAITGGRRRRRRRTHKRRASKRHSRRSHRRTRRH